MEVMLQKPSDSSFFAEGCEIIEKDNSETIYQLTYRERKILVWDAKSLNLKTIFDMPPQIFEGWGMTKRINKDSNGRNVQELYISDGSQYIYIADPDTFKIKKQIEVKTSDYNSVYNLNELEFVRGKLWSNVFMSNSVAVIDPETGFVEAMIDFSPLQEQAKKEIEEMGIIWDEDDALNGIAYYPETDRLLMTGKMWPMMWEIKVPDL